jgi:glycerol transport system ATP-binding protein
MSLELRQVALRAGAETLIHPTDLVFEPGSFNILLGTTLAGKTTLMKLMAGLERPTSGQVRFGGRDVTGVSVRHRNVSMVYQQFINYPNMTIYENIASPLRVARMEEAEIRNRVGRMAELLKLDAMLERRPAELSGGQQQRTAMARALVKDADLVLLDEPLANLDFKLREELRDELPRLFADRDCIVVYATTEPVEALLFGGNTACLFEGQVTQFGPTGTVYRNPVDLTSAQVFADPPINVVAARKTGNRFTLPAGEAVEAPPGMGSLADGAYTLGIRPHHVSPVPQGEMPVPVDGRVLVTELSGSESIIHFTLHGETWVSQSHGIHPFEVGTAQRLYADMSQAMVFAPDGRRIPAKGGQNGQNPAR